MMFENRSFDHILGGMPGVNGVLNTSKDINQELYNYLDPTNPDEPGNQKQVPFPIQPGDSEQTYISDSGGFDHAFNVMFTDLYGPGTTGVIKGEPQNNPWPAFPAINNGFVNINNKQYGQAPYAQQYPVMSFFEWQKMQVFHKLVKEYVVCDNWFCDIPGHTAPNRAFMHCATTGDLHLENDDNANESYPISKPLYMVNRESIFERLEKFDNTWKMYAPQPALHNNLDTYFLNDEVAGRLYNPADLNQTNCSGVPLEQFCADVKSGNLPDYSFIMCFNHHNDPSMHPVAAVEPGENLLAGVYNTLRESDHWNDTLLVVNFDENGGIYDHVRPPRTVPPHPDEPAQSVRVGGQTYTFDFSILGFRIPAILISPWLAKGVETQQLQNTSILRFLQDRFCVPKPPFDPLQPPTSYLTQRDRFANSIQVVFDNFGLTAPRTDCLSNVEPYKDSVYSEGICTPAFPSEEALQARPKQYMVDLTLEYIAALPGHPDSGRQVHRQFETVAELNAYTSERVEAAVMYYNQQKSSPR